MTKPRKTAQPDAASAFHRALHRWYQQHGRRDLPWRNTLDPYAIYISEIMLQQTQVKTVLERFYFPFLQRFPTLASLADAPQQEVLRAWQGLGYYNRALNLHKAAGAAQPSLPSDVEQLCALPGIGRNTAHAVASFAFGLPVPVMEANVRRVLSRLFALEKPSEDELWTKAEALLDRDNSFDYNQAMMDIGAMICTKRAPLCAQCPASSICAGRDAPERYPAAKAKKKVPVRRKHVLVFCNAQQRYYATPRASRFLSGLYHFVETGGEETAILWQGRRFAIADGQPLGCVTQQYSHFTLEAQVWLMQAGGLNGAHWHSAEALGGLPVSMAEKKVMMLIEGHKKQILSQ